ncbi:MAG: hypothetical protein M1118_09905, partial [Chloroflexi bacterium]|nr:hypothetical protein [Chloroflexota bacterium]
SFGVQNASAGLPLTLVFAVLGGWYPGIIPPLLTAAVSLGLALLSLALGWQSGHRPLLTFAALGTLTGTLMVFYVNGHWDPQAGIDRYGLAVLPFVALLTSAFATSRPFFGVVFLAWLAITAPDTLRMPHAQQTVTWSNDPALDLVLSHWHSRDGVAFESIDRLGYYAIRTRSVTNAIAVEDNGSTFERHDAARRIARELPRLEATHKRVWYVQDGKKPGKLLQQALDSSAKLIRRWKTPSGEVRLYLTAPAR